MATASFTDIDSEEPGSDSSSPAYSPTGGGSTSSSVVTVRSAEVSSPAVNLDGTGIEGEVTRRDINIPKVALVNAMSKARTEGDMPSGAFVFSDTINLGSPKKGEKSGPPIEIFILNARKGYQKYVAYGSDEPLIRAASAEEVRTLGGTLNRQDKSKPLFEETAQFLFVVPAPEGLDESDLAYFRMEHNGKRYAKALFFAKSIAYTGTFKPVTTRVNNTGEGVTFVSWVLQSKFMETEKFSWWTPKLAAGKTTDADTRAWLASKV